MEEKEKYIIGDLVVIKSYPVKGNMISGDPKHVPPIMVVKSIEIENSTKKVFDEITGNKIADRIKYGLVWFDSSKSEFVEKIMYESFLMKYDNEIENNFKYSFGELVQFKTSDIEAGKLKSSVTKPKQKRQIVEEKDKVGNKEKEIELRKTDFLLSFVCPDLVITGIKTIENNQKFDEKGNLKYETSERLIKVMWFNPNQQKYSEYELPKESLITKNKLETHEIEV